MIETIVKMILFESLSKMLFLNLEVCFPPIEKSKIGASNSFGCFNLEVYIQKPLGLSDSNFLGII